MLLDKFLETTLQNLGAPACIFEGKVMSRAQFLNMVCQFALALHERGVQPGETVGVSLHHAPVHLALILALARLGAISLPVHPRSPPRNKLRLMKQFGARRVVTVPPPANAPERTSQSPEVEVIRINELKPKAAPTQGGARMDLRGMLDYWPTPDTLGRIGLTSGTTGFPNAVCYTHAYWLHRILNTVEHCDESTRLMPGNLHLTMGNISAFAALLAGGVVVFHKQRQIESYISSIQLYAVTHAMTSPATIKDLAAALPLEGNAFPSIRYLRIVGGGLSENLVTLAKRHLTPNIWLPYGISEVGAISMADPALLDSNPDYAGRPKPGVQVEVVSPEGKVLGPGEIGELRVRVPEMPAEYYMNPERTAEKFRDGWFYTNDIGTVTSDGLVRLEGRSDDRINLGGLKLYPERVEAVLNSHPDVRDSGVFTVSDKDGNKVLVAAVVLKQADQPVSDMVEFCKERKLGGMTPRRFFIVKELPRNEAGKLMRAALPELLRRRDESVH
ncbi:class I adenylate-forming enzyme family protein [Magnetospirillum moscoviense]|jgi:acyl-coenzyme A synthetase/AMP-(fatty) acid ligase|nr:fatty acid--CoA ligase family protein [Magnetospirillum moscoviense]